MPKLEFVAHKPIVLIGLMGAGKTTVGRRLAKRLAYPFVDSDQFIERETRYSIAELMESFGEPYFRDLERKTIIRLMEKAPQVIATGGGAYMCEDTRKLIRDKGISIWLQADLDVLLERVKLRDNRPLLKKGNKREILANLIETRYPIYAQADITIESDSGQHSKIVEAIIQAIEDHAF